jgi:hypothetical protein
MNEFLGMKLDGIRSGGRFCFALHFFGELQQIEISKMLSTTTHAYMHACIHGSVQWPKNQ